MTILDKKGVFRQFIELEIRYLKCYVMCGFSVFSTISPIIWNWIITFVTINLQSWQHCYLPDICHGTFGCRIQCTMLEFPWIGTFSYEHRPECRTFHPSFPKCLEIWKLIFRQVDIHGDLWVESFCLHHYEQSNHWPASQIHLEKKNFIKKCYYLLVLWISNFVTFYFYPSFCKKSNYKK